MFVFWKVVFGKPLSKLSCIYLLLEKLVNKKYFPVNRKHFPVKEKFGLVSSKVFSLLAVFVFRKIVFKKSLSKLSCVCLSLEKLVNEKYFPVNKKHFHVKEKFDFISRKVLFFYFGWKHFLEVVKNLEILYYLLIMSNLVLKFLIAIYFIWIF